MLTHTDMASAADVPTEAVYDLGVGGTQEFVIQDENGETATVIIEEVQGTARVEAGTYKVQYETLNWTAGFYVKISGNKFTSVYSPFYKAVVGTISGAKLSKDSDTKATYSFSHKIILTWNTGLVAKITNSELVVSKK